VFDKFKNDGIVMNADEFKDLVAKNKEIAQVKNKKNTLALDQAIQVEIEQEEAKN
jgi:hypothetical protein